MKASLESELINRPSAPRRLLLPIDGSERSRWGVRYAVRCAQSGHLVAALLLHVAEPVSDWQVRRFLSQERVRRFQLERANLLLDDAAGPLRKAGITVEMHSREGETVFQILDVAEQLNCDEIVLPVPYPRWLHLLYPDITRKVIARQRRIPVTLVSADATMYRPE